MLSDLDFVMTVEQHPGNLPFITPWERTQHEGAVRFPDFRHFIVEVGAACRREGFVILQGCRSPHHAVELKRLVLLEHGRGTGRACLRQLKRMAFRDLGAHRFWLDVKEHNTRALALYASEGFVVEGRLRECVRGDDGLRLADRDVDAGRRVRRAAGQRLRRQRLNRTAASDRRPRCARR